MSRWTRPPRTATKGCGRRVDSGYGRRATGVGLKQKRRLPVASSSSHSGPVARSLKPVAYFFFPSSSSQLSFTLSAQFL